MQHDHVLKKVEFRHNPIPLGSWGRGSAVENISYDVAALPDSLLFDMQHYNVMKKLNFYVIPQPQGQGVDRGLRAKYLLPCCCIS